jgi:quercetin dioxygenase-like cupin family protein
MIETGVQQRHHVTRFEPGDLVIPRSYGAGSTGYRRISHIDRSVGAVHTGFGTCELAAQGRIEPHVHSYEELVYVIEGIVELTIDGVGVVLEPDDCAFIGVGATHSWANPEDRPARWIDLETPVARVPDEPPDTFFVGDAPGGAASPLDIRDPRARKFFRWHSTQMDLDALKRPVPLDAPAVSSSMSSALLAYSGIAVKMLIDERHGAHLGNMFMVDYQPDVVLHPHDHPIEEAFWMLEGEVVYIADGVEYMLSEGDVAYAGVGCIHAFENRSGRGCRWLETRAPLPPIHHAYRFNRDWDYLGAKLAAEDQGGG